MARHNLLKKVAPVVMSAAVAFSSMPVTAFASDFADSTVEASEVTEEDAADVDVADAEAAEEDAEDIAVEDVDDDELDVAEEEDAEEAGTEETASEEDSTEESDDDFSAGEEQGEYTYLYAGLTWEQYWASEKVYQAGNTESSSEKDSKGEYDKGAFDAVTRATQNHGLHRASFQSDVIMYDTDGNGYELSYWPDKTHIVLTDKSQITFDSSQNPAVITKADGTTATFDHYVVYGLKYVPVAVKTSELDAFKEKFAVVLNGDTLQGGYGENNLQSYTGLVADVNADTNGLKYAVKGENGFTFEARNTGTGSGIKDAELAEATDVRVLPLKTTSIEESKFTTGSYGEFVRIDIDGTGYGALGAKLQAARWDYYGNAEDTTGTPLRSFGTKFVADNWMHGKFSIQLSLTDSIRCQLPENTNGTGLWKVTVYALGYKDYTFTVNLTEENLKLADDTDVDVTELEALVKEASALKQDDYTADSWAAFKTEFEESKELVENPLGGQSAINEQIVHLREAMNDLVKATFSLSKTTGTLTVGGTEKLTVNTNITTGKVTWKSSNEKVATVADGVVTAKAAGTATITATLGSKSATYTVTVKAAETKAPEVVKTTGITATLGQVYVGKKATIKVTKENVTGTAKFTSSNKKVATVNAKGVVTGKKAGTAKITVTVGKYKKVLTVKVKKPSFKLAKSSAKIKKGKTTTIKVKAAPVSKVTYKSSNKKVATVTKKGVVKGKKKGTATVTVKCNGITRKFKVTVK